MYPIFDGFPQESVLAPFLYLIYTLDLPVNDENITATFPDDTAILVSEKLQDNLNKAANSC